MISPWLARASLLALFAFVACDLPDRPGGPPPDPPNATALRRGSRSAPSPRDASSGGASQGRRAEAVPWRLVVLRLGEGAPEVLRSQALPAAQPPGRRGPRAPGRDGRYAVLDGTGRVLARGAFRIPRRVHALFGEVDGPAGPASAPLARPVVWLRVPAPREAARLRLRDAARGIALGEVAL